MARSLEAYAELALEVATRAGELAVRGFRREKAVREKRTAELVTEYDLASEALIRGLLSEKTPDIPVIGEETGGVAGARLTWYCDPIDGTTNFVHGHPFWSVSVGLMEGTRPLVGAVVAPSLGIAWCGGDGIGSFRNGSHAQVSATTELRDALVATGFPSDRSQTPANNFLAFERAKTLVRGVRRCGSAAIDACLVADGTYDAYWERALSAWDLAGGAAIALGAGARLTALDGGTPDVSRGHILLSNGLLHAELIALIRDA